MHIFNRAIVENFCPYFDKDAGFMDFLSYSVHSCVSSGGKGEVDGKVEC